MGGMWGCFVCITYRIHNVMCMCIHVVCGCVCLCVVLVCGQLYYCFVAFIYFQSLCFIFTDYKRV